MSEACEHKFVHLRSESYKQSAGRYAFEFFCNDYYFCEKCLEEKVVKKQHHCGDYQLHLIPDWAKLITTKIAGYD